MLEIDVPHKEISKIEGYEDFENYYVDVEGNVYSTKMNKVTRLKPFLSGYRFSYLKVFLYGKKRKLPIYVHILVARAFIPKSCQKRYIVHKNGIFTDNRLENLISVDKKYPKQYHNRTKKFEELESKIYINEEALKEIKIAYRASLMKGLQVTNEFDFVNKLLFDLLDDYYTSKGLKKIVHQLRSS